MGSSWRGVILVAVATSPACTTDIERRSLAELSDTASLAIVVEHTPATDTFITASPVIQVSIRSNDHCASVLPGTTITFEGVSLPAFPDADYTDPADDNIEHHCGVVVSHLTVDPSVFARQSTLVIADDTATWTATIAGLDADITVDPLVAGGSATATWNGGLTIDDASFWYPGSDGHGAVINSSGSPTRVHVDGNTATFSLPADLPSPLDFDVDFTSTLTLGAHADASGSSCVGPAVCQAQVVVATYRAGATTQP